ncbi:MAG: GxxExxY protein [Armatimonadota bacterium]|nr:GxxExxY protein [Armatimonadota bacterium]
MQESAKSDLRSGIVFDELSNRVIGAAVEVHKQLGPGFMETIYEQALKIELTKRMIAFESQKQIRVRYESQVTGNHTLDLVVEGQPIVELKAVKALEDVHYAQLRSYLRAMGLSVGLLLNFNSPTLIIKRVECNK